MRFTVRRPASAEVSPCCHRPSGGDVACSVHVGVARTRGAGFALEHRLALAVSGSDVPARRASLRRVGGRYLLEPTEGFLPQARSEHTPSAAADATVEAALLSNTRTRLLHGAPRRAGHRMHVKGFDADRVEAPSDARGGLSTQSLRRSVSRALSLAIASFVRARRREPRSARASRCCRTFNRLASPRPRPGACNSSPVDNAAETATPRSIPTTLPSPGPAIGSGTWANAMNQRPARSQVMR